MLRLRTKIKRTPGWRRLTFFKRLLIVLFRTTDLVVLLRKDMFCHSGSTYKRNLVEETNIYGITLGMAVLAYVSFHTYSGGSIIQPLDC